MKNTTYTSEAMNFINLLLNRPDNHEKQMELRKTWWDRGFIDQEEQASYKASELKNDAYTYFTYKHK